MNSQKELSRNFFIWHTNGVVITTRKKCPLISWLKTGLGVSKVVEYGTRTQVRVIEESAAFPRSLCAHCVSVLVTAQTTQTSTVNFKGFSLILKEYLYRAIRRIKCVHLFPHTGKSISNIFLHLKICGYLGVQFSFREVDHTGPHKYSNLEFCNWIRCR